MNMDHNHNELGDLGYWVITVSDSRTEKDDLSGGIIIDRFDEAGYSMTGRDIVPDDVGAISAAIENALQHPDTDVVILTGGSGITHRDVTVEAVRPFLEKELPGFGELFRSLSFDEVGPKAMISRALAGITHSKVVFCLPGSKNAVTLALDRIIIPGIGHLLWEARR